MQTQVQARQDQSQKNGNNSGTRRGRHRGMTEPVALSPITLVLRETEFELGFVAQVGEDTSCYPMPGFEKECASLVGEAHEFIPIKTTRDRILYLVPADTERDWKHAWAFPDQAVVTLTFVQQEHYPRGKDGRPDRKQPPDYVDYVGRHPLTGRIIHPVGKVVLDQPLPTLVRMKHCGYTSAVGVQLIKGDNRQFQKTGESRHRDQEAREQAKDLAVMDEAKRAEQFEMERRAGRVLDRLTGKFVRADWHLQITRPERAKSRSAVGGHFTEKCRLDDIYLKSLGFTVDSERYQEVMLVNQEAKACLDFLANQELARLDQHQREEREKKERQMVEEKVDVFKQVCDQSEPFPLSLINLQDEQLLGKLSAIGVTSLQQLATASDAALKGIFATVRAGKQFKKTAHAKLETLLAEPIRAAQLQIEQRLAK